jgi:hypothetical protein
VKRIVRINEATQEELRAFELPDAYASDDLTSLKRVSLAFENKKLEYNATMIIESATNEIAGLHYEVVRR